MAPRTHRRIVAVFAVSPLFLAALACTPKPATPDVSNEEPLNPSEILGRTVPDAVGPLVFPPGPQGRRQRPALEIGATDETDPNTGFRVQSPRIEDGKDSFEIEGQTLRIVFNRPVKLSKPVGKKPQPAVPGVLTLEPAVAGKTVWTSNNALEFKATKPFDPEQTYKVTVANVSTTDDVALAPWVASFTAEPRIEIAGKVIDYLPVPGEPRMVEMFPYSGKKIAAGEVIRVIFDQPVTAKQAGQLITVVADNIPDHEQKDKPERTIAAKFSNGQGKRVEGYTLNPRQVIEVRGDGKFAAGEGIAVEVDGTTRRYTIAGPLTLAKLSCGYSYEKSVCEVSGTALRTDGREVVLEYSNPLAVSDKQIKEAISVSPPLANMNVWSGGSWDSTGRLSISGAFDPSTEYTVSIPAMKDNFGNSVAAMELKVTTAPLGASVSMPEGVLILDAAASRAFTVTTRNVAKGRILAWLVQDNAEALRKARSQVENHETPSEQTEITIAFVPGREAK
jgi:hypothetical protein